MNIVALYKTWDGGEFVDASLASIYQHVQNIVMVHSEVSWLGERGNSVRSAAVAWCEQHDKAGKVHHIDVELTSQEAQYAAGIAFINQYKLGDVVMVVDADEVWEGQYIENARKQIHDQPFAAYRSNMHTYLKTPFYQVDPPFGSPTTFLTDPNYLMESPRGGKAPALQLADVWMHHYTYVRRTRQDVERKIHQSALADKSGETVVGGWMQDVYDRLPEGQHLHAFQRHRRVWQRVHKIWISELPPAMRTAQLLRLWWPDRALPGGHLSVTDGEADTIYRLAFGSEQAVDLGTYHGFTAVVLALACRRCCTVDSYGQGVAREYHNFNYDLDANRSLAERWGNITVKNSDTEAAGREWKSGPVDVLFVDADHSQSGTLANVEAWCPHMRRGGRIIFHDDNKMHRGVRAAVTALRADARFRFFDPGEFAGSLAVCEVR